MAHEMTLEEAEKFQQQWDDRARMSIWSIVRYDHKGNYDCVWKSGLTKREADKRCQKLNEDYHKNYGTYVVEVGK